jgi:SAM-dependent methyltransferase
MKFSFGANWVSYSTRALNQRRISEARAAFKLFTDGIEMRGTRFLDIGFGQGLPLFLAAEAGADAYGADVDPICGEAIKTTHRFFPSLTLPKVETVSILDDNFVRTQQEAGGFDIVYSWGVLHHTGDMAKAFRNAAALVRRNGFLIISVYNRHWTSPFWRFVKFAFNRCPHFLQETLVGALYPIFYFRVRWLAHRAGPLPARGMDLRHDVRDWLGGYPYEYASPEEVRQRFAELGFRTVRFELAEGFTGCNEFVFRRIDDETSGTATPG